MEKIPIEFKFEIRSATKTLATLSKKQYASFVPQHGMEILEDGLLFTVKSLALPNLAGMTHVAYPKIDHTTKTIVGDFESTKKTKVALGIAMRAKLSLSEEEMLLNNVSKNMAECIAFWSKKGWVVESKQDLKKILLAG